MPNIITQKIPRKKYSTEDILAKFCYYFPQYTFAKARQLPQKRIFQMLRVAQNERYKDFQILTMISASPHTKKGGGVKKLLNKLKEYIKE